MYVYTMYENIFMSKNRFICLYNSKYGPSSLNMIITIYYFVKIQIYVDALIYIYINTYTIIRSNKHIE